MCNLVHFESIIRYKAHNFAFTNPSIPQTLKGTDMSTVDLIYRDKCKSSPSGDCHHDIIEISMHQSYPVHFQARSDFKIVGKRSPRKPHRWIVKRYLSI